MTGGYEIACIGIAALIAGLVNSIAGGGSLIIFPVLIASGIPPVPANVTQTVALTPGYLGGTVGQRSDLRGQARRLWIFLPAGMAGGFLGGFLVIQAGEELFRILVPFFILLATLILASQDRIREWMITREKKSGEVPLEENRAVIPVSLASIYGGFFGAGVSVMILGILALIINETITRLNALKQAISFAINAAASVFFFFSGPVVWSLVPVIVAGSVAGGFMGGKLASVINPVHLKWSVVACGLVISAAFFIQLALPAFVHIFPG